MSILVQGRAAVSDRRPLLELLAERLGRWRAARARRAAVAATCAELSRLTDRELDDLGVSRWDIPAVARRAVHGR